MYRQLRAIGIAVLGFAIVGAAGSAYAESSATDGVQGAASATASFQDRDAAAGKIGGILYFYTDEIASEKGYEAYLVDDKGKRYGKAIGEYVAERRSFVIPEGTKITGRAAALGVYEAAEGGKAEGGKAGDAPLATAPLKDYPAYLVGKLSYLDADSGAGALLPSISWTAPADESAYDGYLVEYPDGEQKIAKKASGRYTLPLAGLDILGEVTVTPYKGDTLEYSASARVQTYDDIRSEAADWVHPGDVNSTIPSVSDIHFKPELSGGKTRVSGALSWYDADSAKALGYIVYSADADGRPVQPLADVTNDYPFDGRELTVLLPEFKLAGVAGLAIYAVREDGESAAAYTPVGGDPAPLFVDSDETKGTFGGTVYVKPRFSDYGAALYFVDAWQQPLGAAIDTVQGEDRYFEIPAGTPIPPGAWKLVVYDNGGLEGSEFEKAPLYIGFEDR